MINKKDQYYYGMGNFAYGLLVQVVTAYAVFFATVILKMPAHFVGLVVSLSVVWDAVSDPLMGYISDYTESKKFGRRHLYLLIGAIGMGLSNTMLWTIQPSAPIWLKWVLFITAMFLIKTFVTIFATPYTALGAEITSDYFGRTRIQAIRTAFFIIGLATATIVGMFVFFRPTEAFPMGQMNPDAYLYLGITISIFVFVTAYISYIKTLKYVPMLPKIEKNEQKMGIKHAFVQFATLLKYKQYKLVAGAYLSANIASALVGSLGLHVFTYTFRMNTNHIGIIVGFQFFLSLISQPFWVYITHRYDKRRGALLAVGFSVVAAMMSIGFVFMRALIYDHYWILLIYSGLAGLGVGGLLTIPSSMVADTIDLEEYESGKRTEGIFYGGMTFAYKLSQSIAIFILGLVLSVVGFVPEAPIQKPFTVVSIGLVMAIGSLLAFVFAGIFYYYYSLSKEEVAEIQLKIVEKQ